MDAISLRLHLSPFTNSISGYLKLVCSTISSEGGTAGKKKKRVHWNQECFIAEDFME